MQRREDELAQRELSSRQKVLVELGTEISKAAAENPSSTAARNLLEQFQGALKNFTPLAAIVKVFLNEIFRTSQFRCVGFIL